MRGGAQARPLVEALGQAADRKPTVFHTPGHKRGRWTSAGADLAAGGSWWSWDGGDAVWAPRHGHRLSAVMDDAARLAADLWRSRRSWLLWNGATAGVLAMVTAAAAPDGTVILPREVHRSAIDALVISGARPLFLPTRWLDGWELPLPPTSRELGRLMEPGSGAGDGPPPGPLAVLSVSPTYYGICPDLPQLARAAWPWPLLVDEAHGAHLRFYPPSASQGRRPPEALRSGACLAVHAAHKTLPVLSQAALLHLGSQATASGGQGGEPRGWEGAASVSPAWPTEERVARCLSMVQSTSPQPALLASLDAARSELEWSGARRVAQAVEAAVAAREGIEAAGPFRCLRPCDLPAPFTLDESRLVVDVTGAGLSGWDAYWALVERHNVWPEMADARRVVFIFTGADGSDSADALSRAFAALYREVREGWLEPSAAPGGGQTRRARRAAGARAARPEPAGRPPAPGPQVLTPRQAALGAARRVPWEQAAGHVSADLVTPYPPGTPLLVPGELITHEAVEWVREVLAAGWEVRGAAGAAFDGVDVVDRPESLTGGGGSD